MSATYRSYVAGTQRGYAYGIERNGVRYLERLIHCRNWTAAEIDRAYRYASAHAAHMLYTVKKRRWDLLAGWGPMPGNLYVEGQNR